MVRLRQIFFAGVFTVAPIALTIYLVLLLFGWFDELFQPVVRTIIAPYYSKNIPGLGVALGILFILVVGVFAPSFFGRQILKFAEGVVARLPLVKMVYASTKQIFDAFSQSSTEKFNRVVMVPFPEPNSFAIGFVTTEAEKGWVPGKPNVKVAVFVPTTPNPTSGYLIFFDSQDIVELPMSVEEGIRLVISGGLSKPQYLQEIA